MNLNIHTIGLAFRILDIPILLCAGWWAWHRARSRPGRLAVLSYLILGAIALGSLLLMRDGPAVKEFRAQLTVFLLLLGGWLMSKDLMIRKTPRTPPAEGHGEGR